MIGVICLSGKYFYIILRFFHKLWKGKTDGLTAAAFLVGAASLASRIFGILRDRILASSFGAGNVLDAYYAAFRIPDTLYNLIIIGALSAGFIPVFTEWYEQKGKEEAFRLAGKVLSVILATLCVAVVGLFIAAPVLVPFIAPGFEGEKLNTTIWLTRLMLLSPIFLGMSAVMGGILSHVEDSSLFLLRQSSTILELFLVLCFSHLPLAYMGLG